jgi:predicted NodU family carbamoyl transferase
MLVLGLSGSFSGEYTDLIPGIGGGFFHDATACLLKDGVLVAAVEEERLNRIKKTTKFPVNAIRACLSKIGARPSDIDAVGYYFQESVVDGALNELFMRDTSLRIRYSRDFIFDFLADEIGVDLPPERLVFAEHHIAHGMSGFANSGMDSALVVVMDGRGERHSTTVFRAEHGRLESIATYGVAKSLGYFYASAIRLLGYGLGDEYKIMGLAPYGDPEVYGDFFRSLYDLKDDGDYVLRQASAALFDNGFIPRRKGEDFSRQHIHFAAGVQHTLETIAMHVFTHWAARTGLKNLCFVGGVAHNSSLNGRILRSGIFDRVFIHPAAHDAGAAEGAAIVAARQFGALPARTGTRMRSASLGPDLGSADEIAEHLSSWSDLVEYERCPDVVERAAELLAGGSVLGWAYGSSEFGPRALGNRSILADARPSENKQRINAMIKKREGYRPFAPVVTPAAAAQFFEIPDTEANYDFMSYVVNVRSAYRDELGAVTHVDGSARLQIIDPATNERFHRLVERFGEITGTPVLLNTSFNNHAEPIVQSLQDALTSYLTTELDYLVVEDFLIRRRPAGELAFDHLILQFRPVTRLARHTRMTRSAGMETHYEIYLDYARGDRAEISPELYAVLEIADGAQTVGSLAKVIGGLDEIRHELYALWQRRFFTLTI